MDKDSKERVKMENSEKWTKWSEAERWSVRKRSWRGIEKNKWIEVLQREGMSENRKENGLEEGDVRMNQSYKNIKREREREEQRERERKREREKTVSCAVPSVCCHTLTLECKHCALNGSQHCPCDWQLSG